MLDYERRPKDFADRTERFCNIQFDHVIIGAGPAGLTLAARLSEDPSITVGVFEGGELVLDSSIYEKYAFYSVNDCQWNFDAVSSSNFPRTTA